MCYVQSSIYQAWAGARGTGHGARGTGHGARGTGHAIELMTKIQGKKL